MIIPDEVKNFRGPHIVRQSNIVCQEPVYNEPYSVYKDKKVSTTLFYNDDIKNRVYKIYQKDFIYFEAIGIKYDLGITLVNQPYVQTEELLKKFTFIQGKDQLGNDFYRVPPTYSIRVMMLEALSSEDCDGFNTCGFMKKKIDRDSLQTSIYFNKKDGIYIKK
jgi:hypothetical protein